MSLPKAQLVQQNVAQAHLARIVRRPTGVDHDQGRKGVADEEGPWINAILHGHRAHLA